MQTLPEFSISSYQGCFSFGVGGWRGGGERRGTVMGTKTRLSSLVPLKLSSDMQSGILFCSVSYDNRMQN